ncbi:MAG: gluconate 2-dehydrogenase subunit 3 family protein [Bacillota bacterium]
MPIKTHYPGFSVLDEERKWDPHTRAIVKSRTGSFGEPSVLTAEQTRALKAVLVQLIADDRAEILRYLVDHLDQKLRNPIGQAERKTGIPSFSKLLPMGLDNLDRYCVQHQGGSFDQIAHEEQCRLLQSIAQGALPVGNHWGSPHQSEFFTQLLAEAVSAYYSHPWVWSSIGYAGPAYPRGYMRIELGLTEPWEANRHGE